MRPVGKLIAGAVITLAAFTALALIAGTAVLFATSPARAADVKPFIIDDDEGGNVDHFRMWYQRVAATGVPVILRGMCISACTFILILPREQVCAEPTASLGFHIWMTGGKPDPTYTDAAKRRFYPEAVQEWLKKQKPLRTWPITFMPAADIVSLGVFPACAVAPVEGE